MWILTVILLGSISATAQDGRKSDDKKSSKEDPAHDELRGLRDALKEAFNKKDIDALLKHLHPDVIVTWQNGEVSKGPEAVRDYYKRMLVGDKSVLIDVQADPEVTDLSLLFGEPAMTAVAYGKLKDRYKLRDGSEFTMDSRFSATAVKKDGKWLIVNFHGSTNVFENDVLRMYVSKTAWWTGGVAAGVALLLGLAIGWFLGKKKA
jgi:ketosteroid isomerase-like protein